MDAETVKWFASLGVGGILAWGMFYVHRKDTLAWLEYVKKQLEESQQQSADLLIVVKENSSTIAVNSITVQANTMAITEMKNEMIAALARVGHAERRTLDKGKDER